MSLIAEWYILGNEYDYNALLSKIARDTQLIRDKSFPELFNADTAKVRVGYHRVKHYNNPDNIPEEVEITDENEFSGFVEKTVSDGYTTTMSQTKITLYAKRRSKPDDLLQTLDDLVQKTGRSSLSIKPKKQLEKI